jgi:hypothetical protein
LDLERELSGLSVVWPETPAFAFAVERRRARWPFVVAVALVAVAAAFAVPQSRGAILRFLDLGGVTIERVDVLPPAQERSLAAGLGPVVTRAQAARVLGRPPLVPADVPLHLNAGVVSLLLEVHGRPVLLSEVRSQGPALLHKLVGGQTDVEPVPHGAWLSGAPHVFLFPGASPRLAGDTLLVERGGLLLRIEGPALTKSEALRIP